MPYLVDILALQFFEELVETFIVGVNSNGGENFLDVLGRRVAVAGEAEEKVRSEVLHFELGCFVRWSVAERSLEALWLTC
jgi:hypothetical protein